MKRKSYRNRQLAAIHALAHKLGLDDELYRDLLERVTGERSAARLDSRGRRAVLDELRSRGAPPDPYPGRPHNIGREPMLQKIEALLATLGAPWSYADAIARQMFRVEKVAWLRTQNELRAVIAALDARARKVETITAAERSTRKEAGDD